jgi:flagellin
MDADIAEEATAMAQKQILNHAGISVLAQANSSPQLALKLL